MKRCPNCSEEIRNDLAREGFCDHCGQDFEPVSISSSEETLRKDDEEGA